MYGVGPLLFWIHDDDPGTNHFHFVWNGCFVVYTPATPVIQAKSPGGPRVKATLPIIQMGRVLLLFS